jgi:N-acetylglucosamine kinase-like BadF-type ATPase
MDIFLGIDGGQSSTTAVIGDDTGRVLGVGRGGPCNHVKGSDGLAKFTSAITSSLESACTQAGLQFRGLRFRATCAGFSGGPEDKQEILAGMLETGTLVVTTDARVALSVATGCAPGIMTSSGTGSITFGRNHAGQFARAGGWGYVFGDEGSAFDITRQAVRAILRHEEGWGPATLLREALLSETGATGAIDLLHRFYTLEFPRPQIASYAKIVDRLAMEGDAMARNILLSAAQQLAAITSAVHGQLFKETEPCQIAYVGGVFRSELLLERFRMLVELEDGSQLIKPKYGPGIGALLEAYASAGLAVALSNIPDQEK